MKFKFSILFVLLFISGSFLASNNIYTNLKSRFLPPSDSLINDYDTLFVDPMLDKLTIRYYGNYKTNDLYFLDNSENNSVYRANTQLKYGLGIGYRWLIFNWAFIAPHQNTNKAERGRTFAFDSQLNIYGKRFLFDLNIKRYRGYYLQNTTDIIPNWINQSELIREDIVYEKIAGNLRYQLNDKSYSFKSSYDQTQMQKRSSKSSFLGFVYGYHRMRSDSLIILKDYNFQQKDFDVFNIGLGGGYSQTLVVKKNYFFSFTPELYYQLSWFLGEKQTEETNNTYGSIATIIRCAAGYNSNKYFFGLNGLIGSNPMISEGEYGIQQVYSNIKLIFANRFNITGKK